MVMDGRFTRTAEVDGQLPVGRQEWAIRAIALVAAVYMGYYIAWRWTSSLNLAALWFAVPLVLAETYTVFRAWITLFYTWKLNHRVAPPAPAGLSVDVFVTAYNEPLEVVRKTLLAAREIRYPHKTYLLDDGKRDDLRYIAKELGIKYIRRRDNRHAKAGNLNNALRRTRGDFILQLDADHVPLPHILDRLLGFFQDEKLAYVQSPQDFYNTDSFMHSVWQKSRRIWDEQRFFFSVVQPGRDRWNASFFCGSCAVIRRAALDEIGGFRTETITEDMETALVLHGRGWKSAYYGESLAYGLAADSATAFHVQRLRWAQGTLQILRKYNPLTYPGLTIPQRLCYLDSILYYFDGLRQLVFYSSPLIFLITGVLPMDTLDGEFLSRFIPFLVLSIVNYEALARGHGLFWLTERYNMARYWTYIRGLGGLFARGRLRFNVTPKFSGHVPISIYMPHLALMAATVLALGWGIHARTAGILPVWVGIETAAFWASLGWALWYFGLATSVVCLSRSEGQQRADYRFAAMLPVGFRSIDSATADQNVGLADNLNPSGIALRSAIPLDLQSYVRLSLRLTTGTVEATGQVVYRRVDRTDAALVHVHGVRFLEVSPEERNVIELHCMQHAVPQLHQRYSGRLDPVGGFFRWLYDPRREERQTLRLPARVRVQRSETESLADETLGAVEEISRTGVRITVAEPVAPGTRVFVDVPGTSIRREGTVVFTRTIVTPVSTRFQLGIMDGGDVAERSAPAVPPRTRGRRLMAIAGVREMYPTNVTVLFRRMGQLSRNMARRWSTLMFLVGMVIASAAAAGDARAQGITAFGSAESGGDDVSVFLLGVSFVTARDEGLHPTAALQAYRLSYPSTDGTREVWAVTPSVGLRYRVSGGYLEGRVGYSFQNDDTDVPLVGAFMSGGRSGLTSSAHAEIWGSDPVALQGIASVNWRSEYLWTRGRALYRLARLNPGAISVGGDLGWQGFMGGDREYDALTYGPVVHWATGRGAYLALGAGWKRNNYEVGDETVGYAKLELVLSR